MTNDVLNVIRERSSCKAFADELPEREKLEAIAQAAIQSPSATNKQPWQVIVVTDKALIDEMEAETVRVMGQLPAYKGFYDLITSTGMKLFYNAPCMVVLPIDKKNPYSAYDCGIASQSVCIAAQSLGVASHIIAINEVVFQGDRAEEFKDKLHFPEGYEFGLAVLLGNPAADNAPHTPNPDKITFVD
ncbi:nitroreductase family protein [Gemmiger sp.]|uniref:nitroreductase family protein n=1 Tax=Gemmiger sp. TaxID=2049027 RepID=UPI003F06EB92